MVYLGWLYITIVDDDAGWPAYIYVKLLGTGLVLQWEGSTSTEYEYLSVEKLSLNSVP